MNNSTPLPKFWFICSLLLLLLPVTAMARGEKELKRECQISRPQQWKRLLRNSCWQLPRPPADGIINSHFRGQLNALSLS